MIPEEEVLADLQMKIHNEWKSEQFSAASIQTLMKHQVFLHEIHSILDKNNFALLRCHDTIVKTMVVAKNTHEPNPDELQTSIRKFQRFVSSHAST